MARDCVVLVAGPIGSGKTTAIASLSEVPVLRTEAVNNDTTLGKAMTTVAMDYGELRMETEGDARVRLYGTPGQRHFAFMRRLLEARAEGLMLLLDGAASDPVADLEQQLGEFAAIGQRGAVVVGVTRTDLGPAPDPAAWHARLATLGRRLPVFMVDAREPTQLRALLGALLALVNIRMLCNAGATGTRGGHA